MVRLRALRYIAGTYGRVAPGHTFQTDPETAEELEASGLAERFCEKHFSTPSKNDNLGMLTGKGPRGETSETGGMPVTRVEPDRRREVAKPSRPRRDAGGQAVNPEQDNIVL